MLSEGVLLPVDQGHSFKNSKKVPAGNFGTKTGRLCQEAEAWLVMDRLSGRIMTQSVHKNTHTNGSSENRIRVLKWPPPSPDLNPDLWSELKRLRECKSKDIKVLHGGMVKKPLQISSLISSQITGGKKNSRLCQGCLNKVLSQGCQ